MRASTSESQLSGNEQRQPEMAVALMQTVWARAGGLLAHAGPVRVVREARWAVRSRETMMDIVVLPEKTEESILLLVKRYEAAKDALGRYVQCVVDSLDLEGDWDLCMADMSLVRRRNGQEAD